MQLCFYHEAIVKTTGGYASSINGELEHSHQTIKIMDRIQILFCRKNMTYDVSVTNTLSGSFSY